MRLYIDDDSVHGQLVRLLRQDAHDVCIPMDVGLAGADDPVHLKYAVENDRVLLSRNYDDFDNLHELIMATKGHHPGIMLVRRDTGGKRNMQNKDIARAIRNLINSGMPIPDEVHILNHWQ